MNKILLITGGTGSFGTAFLNKALTNKEFSEIIIFSRDELKQFEMQQEFATQFAKQEGNSFVVGDAIGKPASTISIPISSNTLEI